MPKLGKDRPAKKFAFGQEKTRRQLSDETEARLSKTLDARQQPGSGSVRNPFLKADLLGRYLFEVKETRTGSGQIGVKRHWIEKLCQQARPHGKPPALVLVFHEVSEPMPKEWVAVPLNEFLALTNTELNEPVSRLVPQLGGAQNKETE